VRGATFVLASLAVLAGEARAQATPEAPLSLAGYVSALDALRADLEAGRLEKAQAAAADLRGRSIAWEDETLAPDTLALGAVAAARNETEGRRAAARLRRLLAALGAAPASAGPTKGRADVLARLAPADDIRKGGEVPRLRIAPLTLPERVEAALLAVADWVSSLMRRIREWLAALRPRRLDERPAPGRTAVAAVAFALAVVVVLAVLVLRARRRRGAAAPEAEAFRTVSSRRDEDPLSREASGWEARAGELAAARRWREAIRAWYHAVLVALFQAGLLHHQKGRTNWEYVARLDPRLGWRPGFVELTRLFDREWYGRRTSDAAALVECAHEARGILAAVRGTEGTA
jgi:hypothetical protein